MTRYHYFAEFDTPTACKKTTRANLSEAITHRDATGDRMELNGSAVQLLVMLLDDKGRPMYDSSNTMVDALCTEGAQQLFFSTVEVDYIRSHCKLISKDLARRLDPSRFPEDADR